MINLEQVPIVELDNNKLIFNKLAIEKLQAEPNQRFAVNYWNVSESITFPVIGKSERFTDPEDGNRMTKKHTMSYRGTQAAILQEYGTIFELQDFKDGIFKMTSIDKELENSQNEESDTDNDVTIGKDEICEDLPIFN